MSSPKCTLFILCFVLVVLFSLIVIARLSHFSWLELIIIVGDVLVVPGNDIFSPLLLVGIACLLFLLF